VTLSAHGFNSGKKNNQWVECATDCPAPDELLYCRNTLVASAADSFQQKLFVSGTRSSSIYVIDVIITDGNPHGFAATNGGKYLWAAVGFITAGKTAVVKIDAATGEILEKHSMPGVDELELVNDDRHLYIPGFGTGCYFVFDTIDRKLVARIETDGLPHKVVAPAKDSRFVYRSPMGGTVEEVNRFAGRMGG
jgi:DNA-binding beta-propeller fold protein YncE